MEPNNTSTNFHEGERLQLLHRGPVVFEATPKPNVAKVRLVEGSRRELYVPARHLSRTA